ncbi:GntR family transcriptional regulator [Alicycliphilus sp. B1]|nr:GntR family transcriptional regulator [Alicycliphilus sp. B1]
MAPASPARAKERNAPRLAEASPVALYQQVKDHVARRIQDGSWKAGDRLPSENELVLQFGISRMTVNRALRELAEQGRIVRVAGVGSFVAEGKPQSTLLQIANLASEIRQRGHDYRCKVLGVERVAASMEVAAALDLHTGEPVFHALCVHLENGVPVQLEDRYVNPRVVPDFIDQDFAQLQPSEFLVRNVPYDQMEHVVDAVLPTPAAGPAAGDGADPALACC